MTLDISYRMATAGDLPALAALRYEMEVERGRAGPSLEEYTAAYAEATRDELIRGTHRAWLAEADGEPVGCALLVVWTMPPNFTSSRRTRGFVSNVYTRPTYRRRGIARHLMELLVAWARAEGVGRLILWSSAEGRPLYKALGFTPSRAMELNL
jgi:GNAT superfamily N-acetyltransferase